jgi:hypothetical protein
MLSNFLGGPINTINQNPQKTQFHKVLEFFHGERGFWKRLIITNFIRNRLANVLIYRPVNMPLYETEFFDGLQLWSA